jgi:hypothetical protein
MVRAQNRVRICHFSSRGVGRPAGDELAPVKHCGGLGRADVGARLRRDSGASNFSPPRWGKLGPGPRHSPFVRRADDRIMPDAPVRKLLFLELALAYGLCGCHSQETRRDHRAGKEPAGHNR